MDVATLVGDPVVKLPDDLAYLTGVAADTRFPSSCTAVSHVRPKPLSVASPMP